MLQTIGLMSGTSLDAVDAVLCSFDEAGNPSLQAAASMPIPYELKETLGALTKAGDNEINTMLLVERKISQCYVDVVNSLLDKAQVPRSSIAAVGCHGQTIRHQFIDHQMYTLQLGDMHWLAAKLGIPCVGDFRRVDIALGGQGAPLTPAFHAKVFRSTQEDRVVVNLGGIANVTLLPKDSHLDVKGFDTGPGNGLMDSWAERCWKQAYDKNGEKAASGKVSQALLAACLSDNYFNKHAPKSTGRDYFHLDWLANRFPLGGISDHDVMASLLALTAQSVADAIQAYQPSTKRVILCGGGVYNLALVQSIMSLLPDIAVESSELHGLSPQWVEASCFAWLAYRRLMRLHGNLPAVTGAKQQAILGTLCIP